MYVCIYIYIYIYIHMHTYMYVYICTYIYMYVYIYIYMHICTRIRIHIHTHIYIYTYYRPIYSSPSSSPHIPPSPLLFRLTYPTHPSLSSLPLCYSHASRTPLFPPSVVLCRYTTCLPPACLAIHSLAIHSPSIHSLAILSHLACLAIQSRLCPQYSHVSARNTVTSLPAIHSRLFPRADQSQQRIFGFFFWISSPINMMIRYQICEAKQRRDYYKVCDSLLSKAPTSPLFPQTHPHHIREP